MVRDKRNQEYSYRKEQKMKVFLGGTCNESTWRDVLIGLLEIDYFNPVVDDWTEECMAEEIRQRELCDYVLYVLTPLMTGTYAIAEAVDDSNKRPEKTLFCYLEKDMNVEGKFPIFSKGQLRSLSQVRSMINRNGANTFETLAQIANYLNIKNKEKTNEEM